MIYYTQQIPLYLNLIVTRIQSCRDNPVIIIITCELETNKTKICTTHSAKAVKINYYYKYFLFSYFYFTTPTSIHYGGLSEKGEKRNRLFYF